MLMKKSIKKLIELVKQTYRRNSIESVVVEKNPLDTIIEENLDNIVRIEYYDQTKLRERNVVLLSKSHKSEITYVRNKDSYENSRYVIWNECIKKISDKDGKELYFNSGCKKKHLFN